MERIKIEYGKVNGSKSQFCCGIGDGVVDGVFGYGNTQLEAMKDFISKINDPNYSDYGISKIDRPAPEKPTRTNTPLRNIVPGNFFYHRNKRYVLHELGEVKSIAINSKGNFVRIKGNPIVNHFNG